MSKAKKKATPKKATTAIAVRPKSAPVVEIHDPGKHLPQAPVGQLTDLATVGSLGLRELKLTAEEEAVLSEPVNPALIAFKPKRKDGPSEIPYLPHVVYTRWLNRAFGRTGWAIVPTARPAKQDGLILVPFLLYVHGVPVASATGEQEYYESNKQQTYGDVIESCYASALRRLAKRLAVGLELWDKDWLAVHAIPPHLRGKASRGQRVEVTPDDARDDEPFTEGVVTAATVPETVYITVAQWQRLNSIAEKHNRPAPEVGAWLRARYRVKELRLIEQKHYAEIVKALEARGSLPMPGDGEE